MKKFGFILFITFIFIVSGCQKDGSNDELAKARKEVSALAASFKIPTLEGYEVSFAQHKSPPKDKQGKLIGNNQEVLVTYTKNKGNLDKLSDDQKSSDQKEILYGPYQGDTLIEITYSNFQADLNDADVIDISGEQILKFENDKYTFLVFNVDNGSISMNFNNLDEDSIQRIAQQIVDENK